MYDYEKVVKFYEPWSAQPQHVENSVFLGEQWRESKWIKRCPWHPK